MSLQSRLAKAPITAGAGAGNRSETAVQVAARLIPEGASIYLVDAADVRGTAQDGSFTCHLSRARINTVGVFLVRMAGRADALLVTSIDSSRMGAKGNAYAQAIKSRYPGCATPTGVSVAAVASAIKGNPDTIGVLTVADALKAWPMLASKGGDSK